MLMDNIKENSALYATFIDLNSFHLATVVAEASGEAHLRLAVHRPVLQLLAVGENKTKDCAPLNFIKLG